MADPSFLHFRSDAVQVDPVRFARLPESARRVFDVVREQGPLTAMQLRQRTAMPPRTVRHAVARLKAEGLLDTRCSLRDCRTCYFFVSRRCLGVGVGGRESGGGLPAGGETIPAGGSLSLKSPAAEVGGNP